MLIIIMIGMRDGGGEGEKQVRVGWQIQRVGGWAAREEQRWKVYIVSQKRKGLNGQECADGVKVACRAEFEEREKECCHLLCILV